MAAPPRGADDARGRGARARQLRRRAAPPSRSPTTPSRPSREADVVFTVGWWWMQPEDEKNELRRILRPYQVNEELWAHAKPGAKFMHCLPAIRGEEMTDAILDAPVLDRPRRGREPQALPEGPAAGPDRHRRAAGRSRPAGDRRARCCAERGSHYPITEAIMATEPGSARRSARLPTSRRTMGIFSMTLFAVSAMITLDTVATSSALGVAEHHALRALRDRLLRALRPGDRRAGQRLARGGRHLRVGARGLRPALGNVHRLALLGERRLLGAGGVRRVRRHAGHRLLGRDEPHAGRRSSSSRSSGWWWASASCPCRSASG